MTTTTTTTTAYPERTDGPKTVEIVRPLAPSPAPGTTADVDRVICVSSILVVRIYYFGHD